MICVCNLHQFVCTEDEFYKFDFYVVAWTVSSELLGFYFYFFLILCFWAVC